MPGPLRPPSIAEGVRIVGAEHEFVGADLGLQYSNVSTS